MEEIIRVEHNQDKPWFLIHSRALEDERLSWEGLGLLVRLLSQGDKPDFHEAQLAGDSPESQKAYRSAMNNLMECGYVKVEHEEGQEDVYTVSDVPM